MSVASLFGRACTAMLLGGLFALAGSPAKAITCPDGYYQTRGGSCALYGRTRRANVPNLANWGPFANLGYWDDPYYYEQGPWPNWGSPANWGPWPNWGSG